MAELTLSEVQRALATLGFDCPGSGELDEATSAALLDFQRNMLLPETGLPDEATQAAIARLRHIWQDRA